MAMTLEEVRDKLRFEQSLQIARGCPWDAEEPGAMADAIDAHITQPAQAVDVGAIREVIATLRACTNNDATTYMADKLTRALPTSPTDKDQR